jgi:hypothetical protein
VGTNSEEVGIKPVLEKASNGLTTTLSAHLESIFSLDFKTGDYYARVGKLSPSLLNLGGWLKAVF